MTDPPASGRGAVPWLTAQSIVFGAMAALLGIVANAMFLDEYGSAWLPATYIAIGAAGIVVSGAVAKTAQRFDLLGIALSVLGAAAAGLGVAWIVAAGGDAPWVSVPLLVLFPILIQLGFVFIGGQAGRLLDIAGIKSSFPRIMAGFPAGAVIGGLLGAELVGRLGRTEDLLLATALAQAAFTGLLWATGRAFGSALRLPDQPPARAEDGGIGDDRTGRPSMRQLYATPFVALILAYQVLSALGSQLADFLVFDRAAAQFAESSDLARFLAGYTAVMNVVSIAFLVVLAGPLLQRFGLRLGIAANPVVLTLFAGAMVAINAIAGGTSLALLAMVSAARIADIALTDGTTRTSINAAYQVLPGRDRLQVQTAVEGIGVPVAIGISGVLILVLNALPFALTATIGVTAIVCAVWTWVGALLYRAYGRALVHALQRDPLLVPAAELDGTAGDAAVALDLLSNTDPRAVRLGLDVLTAMSSPSLSAELAKLTRDPRPQIRLPALAALAGAGDEAARRQLADEVPAFVEDEDLNVRSVALESLRPGDAFGVAPTIAALGDPRLVSAAAAAVGRLGDTIVPAMAAVLEATGSRASRLALRLVRAATARSPVRDEALRRHIGHPDRELALAVTERLAAPEPSDAVTASLLDAAMTDDARHAARILAASAALDDAGAKEARETDEPLRRALRDELDLAGRKVTANLLARHGSIRLGPALLELGNGGRPVPGRSNGALALEALGVLLSAPASRLVLALLQPDLSTAERLQRLRTTDAFGGATDLTGWLRDMVEDADDQWRSSWVRACAIHAARARGLLHELDLDPARALTDPVIDEVLAEPSFEPTQEAVGGGSAGA